MLTTLLSLLGGGVMRLLPELVAFFNKTTDNAHELAMLDKQIAADQARAAAQIQTQQALAATQLQMTETQGDINAAIAQLAAQQAANTSQMQKVGVVWIDALNFLVRPLTTYYFLAFYGGVKAAMVMIAISRPDPWTAIIGCWTDEDRAILSGILSFWFVGRVLDKKQR